MNINLYLIFASIVASASVNLTISDLVTSKVYSEVETIGFEGLEKKQLHPDDYSTSSFISKNIL